MLDEYKLIEKEEAQALKERFDLIDDAYYIDRSKHHQNRGLKGEVGSYHSVGGLSLPKDLRQKLHEIAPKKDLPVTEILINKYKIGDWIPPHEDDSGPAYCSTLHVADSEEGLSYIGGLSKNKAGWCKEFPMNFVHWVEPVTDPRYSVLFLYGRGF